MCETEKYMIVAAEKADAPLIAQAVMAALGQEITRNLTGSADPAPAAELFTLLARHNNSQYSYRNVIKAVDQSGRAMGFAVSYDGARLHKLREALLTEARRLFGRDLEAAMGEECSADEYYLDSLAVVPEYRGRGVAKALIEAVYHRAEHCGKPLGLLCETSNVKARRLYDSLGFKPVGQTPLAGELLDHLQKA